MNRVSTAVSSRNLAAHTHLGHQAVIIFFVLSGYFVGGGALRAVRCRQWSTKSYLLRRLTRLWVVLLPALLLGALIDTAGVRLFHGSAPVYAKLWSSVSGSVWNVIPNCASASAFAGNALFLQGILVPCFGTNGALWSLSYEFWYYIMFPLLLAGCMPSCSVLRRTCFITALIALGFFCGKDISLYFLIWLMGALIYCLPLGISEILARRITPWMCVLFVAFNLCAVIFPYNLMASDFTTGIFFSVIVWLLLHYRQPARKSLYRDVSTRLSAMSYTLYTVHTPIIVFLSAWLVPRLLPQRFSLHSLGSLAAAYAVTFSIAYLFYRCFEANTGRIRRLCAVRLGI